MFHSVAFNRRTHGRPPFFTLPAIESLPKMLQDQKLNEMANPWGGFYIAGYVCGFRVWSLELPQAFENSFRLGMGIKAASLIRAPFGRRLSPVLCRRVLQPFVLNLDNGDILTLHHIAAFCTLGLNRGEGRRVTKGWVER